MTSKLEETIYYSALYRRLDNWLSVSDIIRIRLAGNWTHQSDEEFVKQAILDRLEKVETAMREIE